MNSKFVKKVLILVSSLMAQTVLSNIAHSADLSGLKPGAVDRVDTNTTDGRYALPPSKVNIEPCQRKALLLHPGTVEKQQILHRHGAFLAQYAIQAHDGSEWVVLCDLADGNVIREQKLVDDAL
ncbi:hypothetical protein [Methylobacter sp.]|uniref:hypothetical protein n=1 Tax=Methylobacter sp. TaxID=2051955 RepID=UPI0012079E46|nr:hypothetical protein [Methylobacter sp.]TAK64119.1 MAG: hypothetical protein EPO18_04125 [Methylobacter sp.]